MSHAVSLSSILVSIPDAWCFRIIQPQSLCIEHIYTFLDLSVTRRRFILMDIFNSDFCVQRLWENSTGRLNCAHWPFSDQMLVVGCRLAIYLHA